MKLKLEKIIVLGDGTRVKLRVALQEEFGGDYQEYEYVFSAEKKAKRKRTWCPIFDKDSHEYRVLSVDERKEYRHQKIVELVGEKSLQQASAELWLSLAPRIDRDVLIYALEVKNEIAF